MPKSTNKSKLAGLLTVVVVASWMFVSCGSEKKTEETEATPPDSTEQMVEPKTEQDSLPPLDSSATTRPEPRST